MFSIETVLHDISSQSVMGQYIVEVYGASLHLAPLDILSFQLSLLIRQTRDTSLYITLCNWMMSHQLDTRKFCYYATNSF